jgi:hypothetical protein
MDNTANNSSNLINKIKEILNSESLKEKYENTNKNIFIIIEKIIDKNPDFFILIEEMLLELVVDNQINLNIFNYAYFIDKIKKLFNVFNNLLLNDLDDLLCSNNFCDLLKFIIIILFDSTSEKSEEVIEKLNNVINSFSSLLTLIK